MFYNGRDENRDDDSGTVLNRILFFFTVKRTLGTPLFKTLSLYKKFLYINPHEGILAGWLN